MTKTYALKRLLEHGPMSWPELIDCTGWGPRQLQSAIRNCMETGAIKRAPNGCWSVAT